MSRHKHTAEHSFGPYHARRSGAPSKDQFRCHRFVRDSNLATDWMQSALCAFPRILEKLLDSNLERMYHTLIDSFRC